MDSTVKEYPFWLVGFYGISTLCTFQITRLISFAQLAGAVEYTDCTSAEGMRPHPQRVSCYDTKQSDQKVPVMLELWGMRSTSLLPSLPSPLLPGVVAADKGPIYGLNRTKQWLEFTGLFAF